MLIKIKCQPEDRFIRILEFIDHMNPFSLLRKRELEALALILYYNSKYKDIANDEKIYILTSPKLKKEICDKLGITLKIFYTLTASLRKKEFIDENNVVIGKYYKALIDTSDNIRVEFI